MIGATLASTAPLLNALGGALVHSIWQGCLIAGALALLLTVMRRSSPNARYTLSCVALLAMLVAPAVTFCHGLTAPVTSDQPLGAAGTVHALNTPLPPVEPFDGVAPTLAVIWLVGASLFLLRFVGGWVHVQRLRRRLAAMSSTRWDATVQRLAARLGLRTAVRVVESAAESVPAVIGWLRPVVLVPTAAVLGLTREQTEIVIAHELAHIHRHDALVNMLQRLVEALLFYHPGVWWVSGRIREEREYCCDDLAVAVCGNPVAYARTLTELEALRAVVPQFALASTGGSLMNRITRIVGRPHACRRGSVAALPLFVIGAFVGFACLFADGRMDDDAQVVTPAAEAESEVGPLWNLLLIEPEQAEQPDSVVQHLAAIGFLPHLPMLADGEASATLELLPRFYSGEPVVEYDWQDGSESDEDVDVEFRPDAAAPHFVNSLSWTIEPMLVECDASIEVPSADITVQTMALSRLVLVRAQATAADDDSGEYVVQHVTGYETGQASFTLQCARLSLQIAPSYINGPELPDEAGFTLTVQPRLELIMIPCDNGMDPGEGAVYDWIAEQTEVPATPEDGSRLP